jgi:hypothetical protein
MFLGRDLAWWSFVVGITALILCFPLAVLANIVTPRLQNWWAERSVASIRKRVAALEKQFLANEQEGQSLSDGEDWILLGIEMLGMLGSFSLSMLGATMFTIAERIPLIDNPHSAPITQSVGVEKIALVVGVFALVFMYIFAQRLGVFRRKRSPSVRRSMEKSIVKLKEQLAKRQPPSN